MLQDARPKVENVATALQLEQVRVRAGTREEKLIIRQFVNEQPVGRDVALPVTLPISPQRCAPAAADNATP
jgi:hypothetical protein